MKLTTIAEIRELPEGTAIAIRTKHRTIIAGVYAGIIPGKFDAHDAARRADAVIVNNGDMTAHVADYDIREALVDRRRKAVPT